MSEEPEEYLAVLKASYDYDPQSDEEIAIKEDQLLFLLQRVDEDWWKVKIKGESQEEETGSGLVPAAYVEQAPHTSTVKALYDYEANAPGELTIKEDSVLLVFGQEDAWLLVQADGGNAGFVPENYTEAAEGDGAAPAAAASQIIIPPSPTRPVSTYVDPAARVAGQRATADDIKTWPVSEVDKKGKKKKGTLGIGNGAIFFASDSDKTPVQKWQVLDIQDTSIEKSKHVHIEVGGAMATSLHFNAGSKDTAEAIITKLEASKAYSGQPRPSVSSELDASPPRAITPKSKNGASVHFDPTSPTVIPRSRSPSIASYAEADGEPQEEEVEVEEEEPAEEAAPAPEDDVSAEDADIAEALYDFDAAGEDELSVKEGEQLMILERDGDEWWKCRNAEGAEGVVPASYLESKSTGSAPAAAPVNDGARQAQEETEREEQRKLKEQAQAEKEKKRRDDDNRARAAAASAEADKKRREREKQKEAAEADAQRRRDAKQAEQSSRSEQERRSSTSQSNGDASSTRRSEESKRAPPPEKTRMWRDRTGQFRVEAAFLGFNGGKLRLHKVNGVVIEVPSERMSPEDMQYVEERMNKKSRKSAPPRKVSDEDDIPLGEHRKSLQAESQPRKAPPPKKGPTIDWFEFFLNAGCDVDDCTRYATSFERDKIDEAILPDITDATMRSLGLREGDIIRVTKAIALRNPKKPDPSPSPQEQLLRDEALAKQMQEEERTGKARQSSSPAPNLFAGPDGVLKPARRGRPQPSKSGPASNVDISRINSASDNIQRTSSPMAMSPASVQTPARTGSVSAPAPVVNGFDDDAWTPRPGSVKPTPTPPVTQPQASTPAPAPTPPAAPPAPALPAAQPVQPAQHHLAKTTESDIFDQLARLSSLRAQSPAVVVPLPASPPVSSPSPASYRAGLGMGPSPIPIGQHVQNQQSGLLSQNTSQQNGARGPYAPVPANQGLLQPLIPTTTGFNNFVPTRNNFQSQPAQFQPQTQPSFIPSQITGYPNNPQPMMSQPTGFPSMGPMAAQPTGMFGGSPGGYGGGQSYQNNGGFGGVQTNPTGFNPGFGQSPFGNHAQSPFGNPSSPPPVPPMPSNNTAPANIFAQMKSGTFAAGNDNGPQSQDKYDALRPNPLQPQATGWGNPSNGFQGAYPAYR